MASDNPAEDILRTVRPIAEHTGNTQRRTRYLISIGALPIFREGAIICMRKSTYLRHLDEQETDAK